MGADGRWQRRWIHRLDNGYIHPDEMKNIYKFSGPEHLQYHELVILSEAYFSGVESLP